MNTVMNVGYSSAQLPSPQSLETALMSANANQIGNVSGLYQNVYGAVPPATNAPRLCSQCDRYLRRRGPGRNEEGDSTGCTRHCRS